MNADRPPLHPDDARVAGRERRRSRRSKYGLIGFFGKHLALFVAVILLVFIVDLFLYTALAIYGLQGTAGTQEPRSLCETLCAEFSESPDGTFALSAEASGLLSDLGVWGFLLDAEGAVVWSQDVPEGVALPQSPQDVAMMAHYGYVDRYPVFVYTPYDNSIVMENATSTAAEIAQDGVAGIGTGTLLVVAYPIGSYVTFSTTSFSESSFALIAVGILLVFFVDLLILLVAYLVSRRSIVKNIAPLSEGIGMLAQGRPTAVDATGDLAEIADDVNAASDVIRAKDAARANWISGVSHDIRTPLSSVLGYADRIAEDAEASERTRAEAAIIRAQGMRMRDLIEDLNLASKLEYDLQPVRAEWTNPASILRTVTADFADASDSALFSFEIDVDERVNRLAFLADERLLSRAVRNLLQNAITHNPEGCAVKIDAGIVDAAHIAFPARPASDHGATGARPTSAAPSGHASTAWYVRIADNGHGVTAEQLAELQSGPANLGDAVRRRDDGIAAHGLGLLLVRGIASAHGGVVRFASDGLGKGFSAMLVFPLDCSSTKAW